jgi:hypothetical protein
VVRIAVDLGQPGPGVGARVPEDLVQAFGVPSGERRVPVFVTKTNANILCPPVHIPILNDISRLC